MNTNQPKITTENLTSLASKYNVNYKTMRKWLVLADLLKTSGTIYTPKEVKKIYEHLGYP